LMGSFKGASASGYFALPMTRAKRSAAMAADGRIGAIDRINAAIDARRILIRRSVQPKRRRSQPTPRRPYPTKSHYQTAPASAVNARESHNWPRRFIATGLARGAFQSRAPPARRGAGGPG